MMMKRFFRWLACAVTVGVTASVSVARAEIIVSRIDIGLPNTAVFLVSGAYDGNEILRFKSAIADVPPNVRIVAALNSPGGRVTQGFALGRFFYDARITTMVLAGHFMYLAWAPLPETPYTSLTPSTHSCCQPVEQCGQAPQPR